MHLPQLDSHLPCPYSLTYGPKRCPLVLWRGERGEPVHISFLSTLLDILHVPSHSYDDLLHSAPLLMLPTRLVRKLGTQHLGKCIVRGGGEHSRSYLFFLRTS